MTRIFDTPPPNTLNDVAPPFSSPLFSGFFSSYFLLGYEHLIEDNHEVYDYAEITGHTHTISIVRDGVACSLNTYPQLALRQDSKYNFPLTLTSGHHCCQFFLIDASVCRSSKYTL